MSRRIGLYEALEKCFETSSHSESEAIEKALNQRHLKKAASEGDVETVKQFTSWANIKFKSDK
jgi:DNA sulfur modification protein DndC